MSSCNGCGKEFEPQPWKEGWTDTYCRLCQKQTYKKFGSAFERNFEQEIAAAQKAAGVVEEPEALPVMQAEQPQAKPRGRHQGVVQTMKPPRREPSKEELDAAGRGCTEVLCCTIGLIVGLIIIGHDQVLIGSVVSLSFIAYLIRVHGWTGKKNHA